MIEVEPPELGVGVSQEPEQLFGVRNGSSGGRAAGRFPQLVRPEANLGADGGGPLVPGRAHRRLIPGEYPQLSNPARQAGGEQARQPLLQRQPRQAGQQGDGVGQPQGGGQRPADAEAAVAQQQRRAQQAQPDVRLQPRAACPDPAPRARQPPVGGQQSREQRQAGPGDAVAQPHLPRRPTPAGPGRHCVRRQGGDGRRGRRRDPYPMAPVDKHAAPGAGS
jgi:hypothetical protein